MIGSQNKKVSELVARPACSNTLSQSSQQHGVQQED